MIHLVLHSLDPKLQPLLASALKPEFRVTLQIDRAKLKQIAEDERADILVLDFDSTQGLDDDRRALCEELARGDVPVIVMTDDLRRSRATEFIQQGAFDCIGKPPSLIELKVIGRRAHEHRLMKKELQEAREAMRSMHRCDQLIGSSGRAQVVYDLIRRVAGLTAFILITGESGTGKELVARAIHNLGNRAKEPFVPVACGAIPESLIEAELFGHDKGAFTGSTGGRAGHLEQAGRGTVFLDEIGELSLNTQVKLLRVLQEREFSRLGSNKIVPLEARVLFATHRDLAQMVEAGTFRRDLFFRVNVMSIRVPSLRERTEDIPILARHFVEQYAREYGKYVSDIHPAAMEALVEYEWPGNIRELENIIQRAIILTENNVINQADLPDHLIPQAPSPVTGDSFEERLRQFKLGLAVHAVSECSGNKTLAARKLQVSRAYLHRLIRLGPAQTDVATDVAS